MQVGYAYQFQLLMKQTESLSSWNATKRNTKGCRNKPIFTDKANLYSYVRFCVKRVHLNGKISEWLILNSCYKLRMMDVDKCMLCVKWNVVCSNFIVTTKTVDEFETPIYKRNLHCCTMWMRFTDFKLFLNWIVNFKTP